MQNTHTFNQKTKHSNSLVRLVAIGLLAIVLGACENERTAEDYWQEAQQFLKENDDQAAAVALKNTLQLDPNNAQARYEIGKLYLQFSDFQNASKQFSFALENGFPKAQLIVPYAEALDRSNASVELSELEFENLDITNAEKLELGFRKAQALFKLAKNEQGMELAKQLLEKPNDTVYWGMIDIYRMLNDSKNVEALAAAEALLEDSSANRDLIGLSARLYLLNQKPREASKLYEDYLKIAKDDHQAKYLLVNLLIQQREPKQAEPYIDQLLELNPNQPIFNQLKATVRAAAEDYEAAKEYAEKAIVAGNRAVEVRVIAGLSAYQQEDYEDTVKHISTIVGDLPESHPALRMLVASQLNLGMESDANKMLKQMGGGTSDDLGLYSKVGLELIKSGDTKAAEEVIQKIEALPETPDSLVDTGLLKLSLDDVDGLLDLEKAVSQAPDSESANAALASAYLNSGDFDAAMNLAKKWQQRAPDDTRGYLYEIEILQRQGKLDEAEKIISRLQQTSPDDSNVRLSALTQLLLKQDLDGAKSYAEQMFEDLPNQPKLLLIYYQLMNQKGDVSPALARIENAYNNVPESVPVTLLYAESLSSQQDYAKVLEVLDKLQSNKFTPSSYFRLKGAALLKQNKVADALEHYNNWSRLFPKSLEALQGYMYVLDATGNFAEGAIVANSYLVNNDNVGVKAMEAYFLSMSNSPSAAQEAVNSLPSEYQQLPFVRGIKAKVALLQGRFANGQEDARVAYEAAPDPINLMVYVQLLEGTGQQDKSIEVLKKHVESHPDDIRSQSLLAERLIKDDPSGALASYESMIARVPNNPLILNNAAFLLMQENKLEKAKEYSSKAHMLAPKNVDFADTYGLVLMLSGDSKTAVDVYNQVMDDKVTDETIILNYVEALLKNDNLQFARRVIQDYRVKLKSRTAKDRLLILQSTYLN